MRPSIAAVLTGFAEQAGGSRPFLAPHSPDLNPIENFRLGLSKNSDQFFMGMIPLAMPCQLVFKFYAVPAP